MSATYLTVVIIGFALLFDFLNGMNDAANSIATIVSTRVLSPRQAVAWAAFFNFVAAFGFGVGVAKTIGKGIVDPDVLTLWFVFSVLIGAIAWTYACTHFGLPISVSHALVGGIIGAGLVKGGVEVLLLGGIAKIALFIVLSPLIGFRPGRAVYRGHHLDLPALVPGARGPFLPDRAVVLIGPLQPGARGQ